MAVKVEKKITAKKRQETVAEEFRLWLEKHPQAGRQRRIDQLNAISDSAYLHQVLSRG